MKAEKDRYEIIQKGITKTGGIMTEEEAMNLLEEAKCDGVRATGGNVNDPYYGCSTQWSAVYKKAVYVVS